MTGRLSTILHKLKERRLPQFMAAYIAVAWIILQVVDQLADRGIIPEYFYPLALVFFGFGVPGMAFIGWFHGAPGRQKLTRLEVVLQVLTALLAIGAAGWIFREDLTDSGPKDAATAMAAVEETEDPRRIAVLYFEDRSPGGELAYLADGLTESLIDQLSQIDALTVISRNGVRPFRDQVIAPDSAAHILAIGTLVEGAVEQSDERLRVSISVIDGTSGEQIGNTNVERPRGDIFELQDDIAREVSAFLRERIGEEVLRIQTRAATTNAEAWEQLQRAGQAARDAELLLDAGDVDAASEQLVVADSLFAVVEGMDAGWVEPIVRRGWLDYRQSRLTVSLDRSEEASDWIDRGLANAGRAIGLAPDNADALELRGTLNYWKYLLNLVDGPDEATILFSTAEADLRASVTANPQQASAWSSLSHLEMNKGSTAEGKLAALRSYEADPYLASANLTLWRLFSASIDLEDAVEARNWCEEGRSRFADDFRFTQCRLQLLMMRGQTPDVDEAWLLAAEFTELSPPGAREFNDHLGRVMVAGALVRADLPDSARVVLVDARADPTVDPIRELASWEAMVRGWLGDFDEAFELIQLFLATNPGQRESASADRTWWMEDLRNHPRFAEVVGE